MIFSSDDLTGFEDIAPLVSTWKVASLPPFICMIISILAGKVVLTALTSCAQSVRVNDKE